MKRWLIRIFLGILALALVLVLAAAAAFSILNKTNGTLTSAGETRRYLVYVPESYDPAVPAPLVISIHGYAEWPAHQAETSRWNDLADQYGFIVVYPAGTSFPMRWRTRDRADAQQDVTFLNDLIDTLARDYTIDPARIYANGLSNGGGMSFVLSCQLAGRIAAVGMVAGAYLYPWEDCQPTRPVPAMFFHGTADPIVPFHGGPSRSFDMPFPDVPVWVGEYAARSGCAGSPAVSSQGSITTTAYSGCDADVTFYTVAGGGHTWPGGQPLPEWITGPTTTEIDASRLMWDFFQKHPLENTAP